MHQTVITANMKHTKYKTLDIKYTWLEITFPIPFIAKRKLMSLTL